MIIQIFGAKKCKNTQKAIRFFKERSIKFQFTDLNDKGISKGELRSINQYIPIEKLIDTEGKQFRKRNLQYMKFNLEEELLCDPLLFRTPILRSSMGATVGHEPDLWKEWIKE